MNMTKSKVLVTTATAIAAASSSTVLADTTEQPVQTQKQTVQTAQTVNQKAEVKEPQNLTEAKTELAKAEPAYKNAAEANQTAQNNLANAQKENQQLAAEQAANNEAVAKNETETATKTAELTETKSQVDVAAKDVATKENAVTQETAKNPNGEKDLEKADSAYKQASSEVKQADEKVADLTKQVKDTETRVEDAKTTVAKTETEVKNLSEQSQDLKNAVKKADEQAQAASDKLAEKEREVKSETEKLQKAVDTAPTDDIVTYKRENAISSSAAESEKQVRKDAEGKDTADAKLVNEKEEMIFSGQSTENLNLTDKQQKEYEASGKISYTPNAKEISKHMVDYINKLREINGIPDRLTYDEGAQLIAQSRAEEMRANDQLEHKAGPKDYTWENIAGVTNGKDTDYYWKDNMVLSDKEMAYRQLLSWFSEYNNVITGSGAYMYGHRNALLFGKGKLGFGLAEKPSEDDSELNGYSSMNIVTPKGESSRSEMSKKVTYVREGKQLVMYLNGRRVQFLPETTFNYISNQKIVTPNPAKKLAQDKLDAYKAQSETELASLRQNVSDSKAQARDFKAQYDLVSAKLVDAQTNLDAVKLELKSAQDDEITLKKSLATAIAEQMRANVKKTQTEQELNRVQTANKSLADAKKAYDTAKEKLGALQKQADELQKTVNTLSVSREKLLTEGKEIAKKLKASIAKVEKANAAYKKTKQVLSEATERYMKAQADVLKFTPQPSKPVEPAQPSKPTEPSTKPSDKVTDTVTPSVPAQTDKGQVVKPNSTITETKATQTQGKVNVPLVNNTVQGQSDQKVIAKVHDVYGGTQKVLPSTGDTTNVLATFGLTLMGGLGLSALARRKKH